MMGEAWKWKTTIMGVQKKRHGRRLGGGALTILTLMAKGSAWIVETNYWSDHRWNMIPSKVQQTNSSSCLIVLFSRLVPGYQSSAELQVVLPCEELVHSTAQISLRFEFRRDIFKLRMSDGRTTELGSSEKDLNTSVEGRLGALARSIKSKKVPSHWQAFECKHRGKVRKDPSRWLGCAYSFGFYSSKRQESSHWTFVWKPCSLLL